MEKTFFKEKKCSKLYKTAHLFPLSKWAITSGHKKGTYIKERPIMPFLLTKGFLDSVSLPIQTFFFHREHRGLLV